MTITILRPSTRILTPGSRGLRFTQPGGGAAAPLLYDTFTDADGTNLLIHTMEVGVWSLNQNNLHVIQSNRDAPGSWGTALALSAVAQPVVAEVRATLLDSGSGEARGLVVYAATKEQLYIIGRIGNLFVIRTGATGTVLAEIACETWTDVTIRAECTGNVITATLNGSYLIQAAAVPFGAYFGVRNRYIGDWFDDFLVTRL